MLLLARKEVLDRVRSRVGWSRSEWAGRRVAVEYISLRKMRVLIPAYALYLYTSTFSKGPSCCPSMTRHIKYVSYSSPLTEIVLVLIKTKCFVTEDRRFYPWCT